MNYFYNLTWYLFCRGTFPSQHLPSTSLFSVSDGDKTCTRERYQLYNAKNCLVKAGVQPKKFNWRIWLDNNRFHFRLTKSWIWKKYLHWKLRTFPHYNLYGLKYSFEYGRCSSQVPGRAAINPFLTHVSLALA